MAMFNSLLPVFLVIMVGYGLRHVDFAPAEVWRGVERIVYFLLFPALLLHTLATANFSGVNIGPMGLALLAGLFTTLLLVTALRRTVGPSIGMTGPAYSSVFQGSLRWNGFVGIAAVSALYDQNAVALAAVAIAVLVPTVNVLSVLILARHASDAPASLPLILKLLSRNPLILACAAGIILNATGIGLPGPLEPTVNILGRAALTLGLIAVGAGLDLHSARNAKTLVILTTLIKLMVLPTAIALYCVVFSVDPLPSEVAILCGTIPTASSSYILARQLGGDADLMASIITASTLSAMVTMPLMMWILV